MAETADKLGLVKTVRGHLHTSHGDHGLVHADKLLLGDVNLERGDIAVVRLERLLVEINADVASGRGGKGANGLIRYNKSKNDTLGIWIHSLINPYRSRERERGTTIAIYPPRKLKGGIADREQRGQSDNR